MSTKNAIVKFIEFVKNNSTSFITILFFLIVIIFFTIFIYSGIQKTERIASDKLVLANQYLLNNYKDKYISLLEEIIEKYPNTSASYIALLTKANDTFMNNNLPSAELLISKYIKNAKPNTLKPLGYPTLIAIKEQLLNDEEAISLSQYFIEKYPKHFLTPSIMENLARIYKKNNNAESANKLYNDIINSYPNTVYATRAKEQLK